MITNFVPSSAYLKTRATGHGRIQHPVWSGQQSCHFELFYASTEIFRRPSDLIFVQPALKLGIVIKPITPTLNRADDIRSERIDLVEQIPGLAEAAGQVAHDQLTWRIRILNGGTGASTHQPSTVEQSLDRGVEIFTGTSTPTSLPHCWWRCSSSCWCYWSLGRSDNQRQRPSAL
jgi:hypothetical protein